MEQVDAYENDMIDYEGGTATAETRNGSVELVNYADPDVDPVDACIATDDDDRDNDEDDNGDLNYYDNDVSY